MGRPSKLTEKQWAEIERRNIGGESIRSLAKEFKVSPALVSARVSERAPKLKELAKTISCVESAYDKLTVSEQVSVRSLADTLKSISYHLGGAAKFGAMTAHRLSSIAHTQTDLIDDVNPMESHEALQGIAGLTKMANSASEIALNLLRANKETVDSLNSKGDIDSMTEDEIRAELAALGE